MLATTNDDIFFHFQIVVAVTVLTKRTEDESLLRMKRFTLCYINFRCLFKKAFLNKTKDWALVQNAALVMKIKVLKLGLVR